PRKRTASLPDISPKICHFHCRGCCKYGEKCRYVHGQPNHRLFLDLKETKEEKRVICSGSLEELESEIVALLKSKGGPVSIAVLPMLFFDKYRKPIQAAGYLTESQRHGKVGLNLTKLLGRLKNIWIIDRPHGQHLVMLTEDAWKYEDTMNEGNDMGYKKSNSNKIYITFHYESSFTKDDVFNYFSQYGPVKDVRIPNQQTRMFGFVTFKSQETAKWVLSKRKSHLISGSRVIVKPYVNKH
ncbi:zinc finger CCCH domain-containing protein 18-like, partial [Wolffia australiana]